MLISYTIFGFHSFYNGAVDLQMLPLLTRRQCKVCDTHVTVKACGPHFKNIHGKNNLCFVADYCVQFPIIFVFYLLPQTCATWLLCLLLASVVLILIFQ